MSKTLVQTVEQLAPDQLAPNPWNRKHFNAESLEELADSIRAVGIIEPIIVRPLTLLESGPDAKFQIIAGERRWRAAQLAGLPWVPCILREVDDRAAREAHAIENLQREDLNAIEEGENYRQLLSELGCKVEDLQARLGKKRSHIYARLKLVDLPEPIRDAIIQGQIDATAGTLLASIPAEKQQLKALGEVMNGGSEWDDQQDKSVRVPMSFRKARMHIEANYRKPLAGAWFDPAAEGLGGSHVHSCMKCPLRTGNIPGLPSGSNPMVCTEPKCFEDKTAAHCASLLEVHRAKGEEVLEGKAAAKLWQYGGLAYNSGYVSGETTIPLPKGKYATLEKALGKRMPAPFYAVNPQGKVCALYRKTAVEEALVDAGLRQPPETDEPTKPQSAEDAVRVDIERKVAVLSRDVLATELVDTFEDVTVPKEKFNAMLLFIIEAMDNSDGFNHDVIMRRRGWTGGHLVEHAKKLSGLGKVNLLLEAFLCDPYGDTYEEDQLTKLAEAIGHKLNFKAAEKQVREKLELEAGLTKPKAGVEQKAAKETKTAKPAKAKQAAKAKGKARK